MTRQILATPKTYPNERENLFATLARDLGWKVTKQGWPDFMCFDPESGGVIFVEVKPPGEKLRAHQWLVMRSLARLGAPCFTSDGEKLFPFNPEGDPIYAVDGDEF